MTSAPPESPSSPSDPPEPEGGEQNTGYEESQETTVPETEETVG